MTIRHHCEQCGQLLKIKDELAGTPNKCPACKHPFIVPTASPPDDSQAPAPLAAQPESAPSPASESVAEQVAASSTAADAPAPPAVPPSEGSRKGSDDFDPVAFLMDDATPARSGTRETSGGESHSGSSPPPRNKWRSRTAEIPEADLLSETGGRSGGESKRGDPKPGKGAASTNAREMLKKAIDDARGKREEMPGEARREPSGEPDLRTMIREFGAAKVGIILGVIVLSGAFYWWVSQPRIVVPPLGDVSGRVTLDGEPLAGAVVNFLPLEKKYRKDKSGKYAIGIHAASGLTDADGRYTLSYIGSYKGTFVGKNLVYLSSMMSDKGLDRIPASWGPTSLGVPDQVKAVDVAEGSNPNFDIDMKSDPMK